MEIDNEKFGGYAIDKEIFDWMYENIPHGTNVLEFGSGDGSFELSKIWNMYCVEHDSKWVGKYNTINYIYAPILKGWYSPTSILHGMPIMYSCILIDGPPGYIGRSGILDNLGILDLSVPIIVDDIQRKSDRHIFDTLVTKTEREGIVFVTSDKEFGVIK